MRVAVVDVGTNSTRLLVADVEPDGDGGGEISELDRRSTVTRLGQDVDATGRLADEAIGRVVEVLTEYRAAIDEHGADRTVAVLTSAVRDAENGEEFLRRVRDDFGLDARTITGEEEARLTFLGATSERNDDNETVVIDIGGGSTEYVVGKPGQDPSFHVSTQMGSVRYTERYLNSDPPEHEELEQLAVAVRETVPDVSVGQGIAVAGTATSLAAIDGAEEVHGYRLPLATCERLVAMLAALPVEERREVRGLHPDRAPTIVAGAVILTESIRAIGLVEIEVSVRDILHGAAL